VSKTAPVCFVQK